MMLIPDILKSNIFNIPGWHTKRKIIVFESDDWGSIRIPSKETYNYLLKKGYPIDKTPYGKDSLESNDDLIYLIETLLSVKNRDNQHPILTLNNITANPDFRKIRETNFDAYHFELFTETYKRYDHHDQSFTLLMEGVKYNLFQPQLHGREHLNINRWMDSLRNGQPETIDQFNRSMYGLPASISRDFRRDFQRAFDYDDIEDNRETCQILKEACNIFSNTWNFKSTSFIAPNFFWDEDIESCLLNNGIKYLQGQRAQYLTDYNGGYMARYHYIGQRNVLGQIYLVRNCYFEPSFDSRKNWVDSCLKEIEVAFRWAKPAIISTHRVNYIGGIEAANRENGLRNLTALLSKITRKWPEVEFISSDQLGEIISQKNYRHK